MFSGRQLTTDVEKTEALSSQYESVYTQEDSCLLPCTTKDRADTLTDMYVTEEDLPHSMREMNENSASGLDKVLPLFIIKIAHHMSRPLKIIFQKSLATDEVISN